MHGPNVVVVVVVYIHIYIYIRVYVLTIRCTMKNVVQLFV